MAYRKLMAYPPAAHMMAVLITSADEAAGMAFANRLRALMERPSLTYSYFPVQGGYDSGYMMNSDKPVIIGPAAASIAKINDIFRFVIYVKAEEYAILTSLKDRVEKYVKELTDTGKLRGMSVQFDFDPVNGI
jgi:primosomal protein N' (replication factor Y)